MPSSNLGNLVYRHGASRGILVALIVCTLGCPILALVVDSVVIDGTVRLAIEAIALFIAVGSAVTFGLVRSTRLELFQNGLVYRGRTVRWEEIESVRYGSGRVGDDGPERVTIETESGPAIVIARPGAKELGQRIQRSIGTRVTR